MEYSFFFAWPLAETLICGFTGEGEFSIKVSGTCESKIFVNAFYSIQLSRFVEIEASRHLF